MLRVEGLVAGYGAADILKGVSFHLEAGETGCIIGPNGAGKSTLLGVLAGLLHPRSGRVWLGGQDVTALPAHRRLAAGIALVPQGQSLFGSMSVEENLMMGAYTLSDGSLVRRRLEDVYGLFPVLRERRRSKARTLSGGMQKMVEIGRALMLKPKLLLLDEPSLGLAPTVQDAVFEVVGRLRRSGVTVLMVEQNARKGLSVSDRGLVLDLGKVVHEGPARDLLTDPRIQEWYLGRDPSAADRVDPMVPGDGVVASAGR